jgi:hypothetical protein
VTTPGGIATSAGTFTVTSGFNDHFASCQGISGSAGTINGANAGASKEAGEPNHAGNLGGRSIWYCWTAPFSGAVTMDTVGSSFDTLLAVYTGGSVNALTAIASNNDLSAGVSQSRVSFSAVGGTTYQIAVDGLNAAIGNVTFNWLLAPPNDHFAKPQRVEKWPATINGRLDKAGDVDSFAVTLQRGQTLQARLEAYTLASKMDGLLRLVTTNGLQLAWNHDFATLDPQLTWAAPEDGLVVVQVMGFRFPADADVRLTGGDGCVYRLHLGMEESAPTTPLATGLEIEPNDSLTNAQPAPLPISLRGSISPAGDEDRFVFEANKDDYVEADVAAAALGSPLDAWLRIEETGGKELVRSDDANGSRDPQVEWKAPASGKFVLAVGSLVRNPGTNAFYQLSVRSLLPDFKATLGAAAYRVTAGLTNDLKISINRLRGFDHKLSVAARGLPDGVLCDVVDVPEKGGEVTLKLRADDAARPSSQPFQLLVRDSSCEAERVIAAQLTGSSTDNGVPGGYTALLVDSIDQLWLTVLPKPVEEKKEAQKK